MSKYQTNIHTQMFDVYIYVYVCVSCGFYLDEYNTTTTTSNNQNELKTDDDAKKEEKKRRKKSREERESYDCQCM
jgi:hypothetical protein